MQPDPGSAAVQIASYDSDDNMKNTEELREGSTKNKLMSSLSKGVASLFSNRNSIEPKKNNDRFN